MNEKDNVDRKRAVIKNDMKSVAPSPTTQMEQGVQDAIHEKAAKKLEKEPRTVITPLPGKRP
ncbi:MAG: hypothetical protein ACXW5U_11170 [Thermoanaerobaculia bacterium]